MLGFNELLPHRSDRCPQRAAGQWDEEAFELTTTLLGQNPEYYTMWNIRREILERLWETAWVLHKLLIFWILASLKVTSIA